MNQKEENQKNKKTKTKYYEISTTYECVELHWTISSFEFNWIIYDLSRIMQLREFVWTLLYWGLDSITIFSLETQQIEVKLVAIDIE